MIWGLLSTPTSNMVSSPPGAILAIWPVRAHVTHIDPSGPAANA